MLLTDKVILVTGCARGIGYAIASRCADEGAIVYAVARKEGDLASLLEENRAKKIVPLYFDIRDTGACVNAVKNIAKTHKRLDALVNNAGIMMDAVLGMISQENLEEMFAVNVFAALQLAQLAARIMMRNKKGSIINISSIAGIRGSAGQVAYSSSKAAVAGMTLAAAHELGKNGIRVNAIAPGFINTDMFKTVPDQKREQALSRVALGRIGTPEDVANVCVFLASDLSSYVSGQIIGVDGDIV